MNDDQCLKKYGKTRFDLLEHYGIILLRIDLKAVNHQKEWVARSTVLSSSCFDPSWSDGKTPFEAMIACINKINAKEDLEDLEDVRRTRGQKEKPLTDYLKNEAKSDKI